MEERKKINLRRHVSPKVPSKYLWRILFYCLLLGGLVVFIVYLRDDAIAKQEKAKKQPTEAVKEIKDFTIEQ